MRTKQLCIPLLLALSIGVRHGRAQPEESRTVQVFVALGDIYSVQRDHGAIRLAALDTPELLGKTPAQIREYFLGPGKRLNLIDRNSRETGTFECTRVEVEIGLRPGSLRSVTLFGYFQLQKEQDAEYLTLGYRAGLYRSLRGIPTGERYIPAARTPPNRIRHAVDGKQMVFVPEDYLVFGQGTNPRDDNFNPNFFNRSTQTVPRIRSFYIDQYEVTNHEFLVFCQRTGYPLPPAWRAGGYPADRDNHPLTVASFADAEAYAAWTGKRLPTELEWEMAARGGLRILADMSGEDSILRSPRIYPFGDVFDAVKCNTSESGHGGTVAVTEMRDESPYGAFGMCGNAAEWTSSWYEAYPGYSFETNALAAGRQFRVLRGGSFHQMAREARSDSRDYGGFPSLAEDRSAGFRLVVDASPR